MCDMCDELIRRLPEELFTGKAKLSVVGVGYVGLPLAVAFAEFTDVIAFDTNRSKIENYQMGLDETYEIASECLTDRLSSGRINYTYDEQELKQARFHIVAVPTPINTDKTPNLTPVIKASESVGRNLCRGSVVVYESTVYPGVTEDICVKVLEENSGLKCGEDFKIAYSPERINPGDKVHRLDNIVKIVSGQDDVTLEATAQIYAAVCKGGIHKAPTIKVAEAAKVIENSQRDINIAFMNELSIVLHRMQIDTKDVLDAMNTKWNALGFMPGLVGGHCIGVDPYYFVYQAENLGYHSQIISAGRRVNDSMGRFIAEAVVKELVLLGKTVKKSKIAVLGITFKEDCNDIRNSKAFDIITCLNEYGIEPVVADCLADCQYVEDFYGIKLSTLDEIRDMDCVIFAVAHRQYKELSIAQVEAMFKRDIDSNLKLIADVKSMLNKQQFIDCGYRYWRL